MSERDEETPIQEPIPMNTGGGINMFGFNFNIAKLIEGGILAVLFMLIAYEVCYDILYMNVNQTLIVIVVCFGAVGLVLGIWGYNHSTIFTMFLCFLRYTSLKKEAKYNPRVKYEEYILKREELRKIADADVAVGVNNESIYQKFKRKQREKNLNTLDDEEYEEIFIDDVGVTKRTENIEGVKVNRKRNDTTKKIVKGVRDVINK